MRLGWRSVAMSNFQQAIVVMLVCKAPFDVTLEFILALAPPPPLGALIAFAMKFGQPDRYAKPTYQCIDDCVCNDVWSA